MITDHDALAELGRVSNLNAVHLVQHYIYIPNESVGRRVASQLRVDGFDVEDRLGADGKNWLLLVKSLIIPTERQISELRQYFEGVAAGHGGEYDGWEAQVTNNPS